MQYLVSFLEGIITFISPCLLPMLPIYISYFAGGSGRSTAKTIKNSLGFVSGFTVIFVLMGALAGTIGSFLKEHQTVLNIASGLIVVFFGLNYIGVFRFRIFNGIKNPLAGKELGFFSSVLFGIIFSLGWTPCVGAFLGSALMLATRQGQTVTGIIMLLCYSMGLGIPFIASAVLIEKLRSAFAFIKKNYKTINLICGGLLIIVGIAMMTGLLGRFIGILS